MSVAPPTSSAPAPAAGGLAWRQLLVIGLAFLLVGEMYHDQLLTWPLPIIDGHWFEWHFAPPLFAWAEALLSHAAWRFLGFLSSRRKSLRAELSAAEEFAKLGAEWVERRAEAVLHRHAGAAANPLTPSPSPASGEGLQSAQLPAPASPVIPIVEPSSAAAQQRGAEAIQK